MVGQKVKLLLYVVVNESLHVKEYIPQYLVAKHLGDIKVRYDSIGRVELCVMHDIPRFLHSVKISIEVDNESRYSLTFVRVFENAIVNTIKKYLKRSGSVFKKFFTPLH